MDFPIYELVILRPRKKNRARKKYIKFYSIEIVI